MSTFSDTAAAGRRSGKAPERSSFNHTCNLISQYLKEKRSSGALSLGNMAAKIEPRATTMDLLMNLEKSDDASRQSASAMDFLNPQFVENQYNLRSPARAEPKAPQMAIFYAGKILVFDAFLPEKATEIMELATKLSSDNSLVNGTHPSAPLPRTNTAQQASRSVSQAFGSDMRYPRRASLLKFLEKRKERVMARGPYHMNPKHEGVSSGGHPEDQPCKPFDLNL